MKMVVHIPVSQIDHYLKFWILVCKLTNFQGFIFKKPEIINGATCNMLPSVHIFTFFLQDDLDNFGDVESFLSNDGCDGNIYGSLKQTLTEHKTETSKGGLF